MKIGFLTPEYPHEKIKHAAGIGTSIKNLVTALVNKGEEVTVFVYGQDKEEIFEENGVFIHLIENKSYRFGKWYFYRKYIEKYINKIVKQKNIELLEAPDWTGITAFMNFNVPLIIRFHGSDTYFCHIEKRKQKLKNFWFEKLAVKGAHSFIAPTAYAGKVSAKLFGISPEKVKTIHYGLALEKFQNEAPDKYQKGLLLYIGTIIRKKGVLELPEIFHKVRERFGDAQLIMIGGDSADIQTGRKSTWELMEGNLQKEDKPFVTYLGKIPYDEVRKYLKKAHVCVFPTFAETLGMVTIESMAMGKPVVNSDIGWAKELIIDQESGFLVYPTDHQKYAERIIEIFENDTLAKKIREEAVKRTETFFDIEKIVIQNIAFYKSIINDNL